MSDVPVALLDQKKVRPPTYQIVVKIFGEAISLFFDLTCYYLKVLARFVWRLRLLRGRDVFTLLVWVTRHRHTTATSSMSGLRKHAFSFVFKEFEYVPPSSHTHPEASKRRNDTVESIRSHIAAGGWEMFDPSPANSHRDTKYKVRGPRHAYSMQDLGAPLNWSDRVRANEYVTLIDQDIHLKDLSDYAPQPICIYTMRVDGLSGKGNSSTWYFRSASTVVETVDGGATYVQELFDYGHDQTVIRHNTWLPAFTVYDIHRHVEEGGHKMVVFLTPRSSHYMPVTMFLAAARLLNGFSFPLNELRKLRNVTDSGNFIVGWFIANGEPFVCVKRKTDVGSLSSVRMPEKVYNALRHLSKISTKSWNAGEAQRYTEEWKYPIKGADLILLVEYFEIPVVPSDSPNLLILPTRPEECYDVPEPKAELIAPSLVSRSGVVVAENAAAERSYHEERMLPNRNDVEPPGEYTRLRNEFLGQLIRQPGLAIRPSLETVLEEQTSAPQRARNKRESQHLPRANPVVRVNLKREVVLKEGPARGITTVETAHTWATGALDRGAKVIFKRSKSWAVGKNPDGIAKMVRALADDLHKDGSLKYLIETDFSKMDETISRWLRVNVFEAAMIRAYHADFQAELKTVLENDKERKCFIGKIRCNTAFKNNSGSGFTTTINTLINMFFKFCVFRKLGFTIIESYSKIGPCYGDDGLNEGEVIPPTVHDIEVDPSVGCKKMTDMISLVAGDLGLKVKAIVHLPTAGFHFLGRVYPKPRTSPCSAALPSRSLGKICVATGSAELARANRLKGYYVTEKHVPLVGDYIRAVARVYRVDLDDTASITREQDRDLWYKVKAGPIPYVVGDEDMLRDLVCSDLKLTLLELEGCIKALREAKTIEDISQVKIQNGVSITSSKWSRF